MFLKYCCSTLVFLMLSSPVLHLSTQKYRTFHFKFQDPLLNFLVISNTVKMVTELQAISHLHTHKLVFH